MHVKAKTNTNIHDSDKYVWLTLIGPSDDAAIFIQKETRGFNAQKVVVQLRWESKTGSKHLSRSTALDFCLASIDNTLQQLIQQMTQLVPTVTEIGSIAMDTLLDVRAYWA